MPTYGEPGRNRSDGTPDVVWLIVRRLRKLHKEIRRPNRTAESTALGRAADGRTPLGVIGRAGGGYTGLIFRRVDGTTALTAIDHPDDGHQPFIALWDRAGNIVHSDDAESGRGIGRPYLSSSLNSYARLPDDTTSSAAWATLLVGTLAILHPALHVHVIVAGDPGTAGEWRLVLDGRQQGDPQPIAAGAFAEATLGPIAVDVDPARVYGTLVRATIDARVTSGSGSVGVRLQTMNLVESSFLAT